MRKRIVIVIVLGALLAAAVAGAQSNTAAVPIQPGAIDAAVGQLDGIAQDLMKRTGVPGMSIAVVHNDAVVYAKGFGVRELGKPDPVDPNTVFQLASVSKPISGTVVARAVGQGKVAWHEPVVRLQPSFALSNRYATNNVTVADLFAHRSGLPDHIGDILEDLGEPRLGILHRLRYVPLAPLRQDYAYTNFGLSAAGFAVAHKAGTSWAQLADSEIYRPLGMTSTSSSYAEFVHRADRASLHVQASDGSWVVGGTRDPDAQAPAGGVSSSALDLTHWMRLVLDGGVYDGQRLIGADAFKAMFTPTIALQPPATPANRTGMSGLGIDISVDATGRVRFTHSGAFTTGASTNVTMLPAEGLGIVVLTNGWPVGVPETVANDFMDLVEQGRITHDWLSLYGPVVANSRLNTSRLFGQPRPSAPQPARSAAFYAGTYDNKFYGPIRVLPSAHGLTLVLGPKHLRFALSHWSGDTYALDWTGENEYGISAVDFQHNQTGQAPSVRLELLDIAGLGTFRRR